MLLMGLRYTKEQIADVKKDVEMVDLRDNTFVSLIREEGMSDGMIQGQLAASRRMILSQGRRKFGASPAGVEATLEGITDQAKLEALADRLIDVSSWEDLLAGA